MLTVYGIETLFNPPGRNVLRGVATVLTVYGIETCTIYYHTDNSWCWLQQCLPFTVLKHTKKLVNKVLFMLQQCLPFTVLKLKQVISDEAKASTKLQQCLPFTVLKLIIHHELHGNFFTRLQQCLPFTVLKRKVYIIWSSRIRWLQQCLPFTVLKP